MVLWTMPTPTSKASCWGCGIARARTVCGSKSRRSRSSRTSRSSVRCRTSPSTRFPGSAARMPMDASSIVADTARQLAAAGRHAEVVEYLGAQPASELADSPSLALLYGTAHARLGRHDEGQRWLDLALDLARKRDEQAVERDALNARGAIALVSGRIDEAADYFTQALLAASRDGDAVTTGRCSNNLGIISNLRGRHAEAIGSWEIAAAAFDRAGLRRGVAECHHNQAIAYREQGELDKAQGAGGPPTPKPPRGARRPFSRASAPKAKCATWPTRTGTTISRPSCAGHSHHSMRRKRWRMPGSTPSCSPI